MKAASVSNCYKLAKPLLAMMVSAVIQWEDIRMGYHAPGDCWEWSPVMKNGHSVRNHHDTQDALAPHRDSL